MELKRTIRICSIFFLLLFCNWKHPGAASSQTDPTIVVEVGEKLLTMQADNVPLGDILYEIRGEFFSEITGLDHRKYEVISLNASGMTVEEIVKQLLRHLGENNYAFEFADNALIKASVLPETKTESAPAMSQNPVENSQNQFSNVAIVHSIVEGSQAEDVGISIDDIILKYDGIKITSSMGLIRAVRNKSEMDQVEVIVVRDGTVLPFILKGGLIGVRISTVKIPMEELEKYE